MVIRGNYNITALCTYVLLVLVVKTRLNSCKQLHNITYLHLKLPTIYRNKVDNFKAKVLFCLCFPSTTNPDCHVWFCFIWSGWQTFFLIIKHHNKTNTYIYFTFTGLFCFGSLSKQCNISMHKMRCAYDTLYQSECKNYQKSDTLNYKHYSKTAQKMLLNCRKQLPPFDSKHILWLALHIFTFQNM